MAIGHNAVAGEQLRSFIERIEKIEGDRKGLNDDKKAIMAEAKAAGFDPGGIRYCIKVRAMKPHDRQEAEAIRDLYMHALGMAEEPPLFRALGAVDADPAARDTVIEAFKRLAPQQGDVIVRGGDRPVRIWRDRKGEAQVEDYVEAVASSPAQRPYGERGEAPPKAPVPDVDDEGAEQLGREYGEANRPVIDNPFPFGDRRRGRFDAGWRKSTGSDGMGPGGG